MKDLRFSMIGADPEYAIGHRQDWVVSTISAQQVFGTSNFAGGIIGTDGHMETGELRPTPAHNVHLLLHNIGEALEMLHRFTSRKGYSLYASPYASTLPLGGHIHLSFRARPAVRLVTALWNRITTHLDYYMEPLEAWFPCRPLRERRNHNYPGAEISRIPKTTNPFRLEYRRPSTWLGHPAIAYVYLATAKLVALNINQELTPSASTLNLNYFESFHSRLQTLRTGVMSADLSELPEMLDFLVENRMRLINPTEPIDIEAWRAVILPRRNP